MKREYYLLVILLIAGVTPRLRGQIPLSSEFTVQGQLTAAGQATTSTADFQFALFGEVSGGTQVGSTIARSNVVLNSGAFTVSLDFGTDAFRGDARWLEISVRSPAGVGGFTTLAPRQALTSTPNSTFSLQTRGISVDSVGRVGIGTTSPQEKLAVDGNVDLNAAPNEYRRIRFSGGELTNEFLFNGHTTSTASGAVDDGIHLGYNYRISDEGGHQFNSTRGTSRLSAQEGRISLAVGDALDHPRERLILTDESAIFNLVDVGINVPSPQADFHLNGSMRMDINGLNSNLTIFHGIDTPIWSLGINTFSQPALILISPVTGDLLAGFYRDNSSGNGVMFADDKNFRAPNPADPATDIWYCCPEGPEAAMYVRGTARLTNGRAIIELPDHFRNLASEPGMTVQLTPISIDSKGLALIKKSLDGIEVGELGSGTGDYEFDWRVEAVRKGWEDYKVIRPWLQSDGDPDKAWQNRLKEIEQRRARGKPSPDVNATTPRPQD